MARVASKTLTADVLEILANAATGKGTEPGFLTAYQILHRLPKPLQDELQSEYGASGRDGGSPFSPASRVAQVASDAAGVEKRYFDTRGLQFDVGQSEDVGAGYSLCAIFRWVQ